ncbi:MAG: outer membrane beta-barrel protein [Verrucomicrobia bacterium]|nr:outer membrane beta-barrel protein [Verrucomicrobiota bacterium]
MKKSKSTFTCAWAVLLAAFCFSSVTDAAQSTYTGGGNKDLRGGAWGPFQLGDRAKYGTIRLRANQEFTYDDNIYLTETGRSNDWVSISSPGISYRLGNFANNAMEVGYDVNVVRFFDYSQEDAEEHNPYFKALFTLGATKLSLQDGLSFIMGGTARTNPNEVSQRTEKTTNDAKISSETKLSDKLSLGLYVHHYYYNPKGSLLERNEVDGGADAYWKAFAKLDLFIGGAGGFAHVRNGAKEDFGRGHVGFRGDLTPKLVGRLEIGGEHRTSDNATAGDQDNATLSASLTQTFTDDFTAGVNAKRYVAVSTQVSGQTYVVSGAGFNLNYQFGPILDPNAKSRKFASSLVYSYENDDFDMTIGGTRQNTDIHTVSPSLEYRIQEYWKVYVVYQFQDLDSNLLGSDFANHRVSLGSSIFF